MIKEEYRKQYEFELVNLEEQVPDDHILRFFDEYIDFSFVYDIMKDTYNETFGRPAINPITLFKIILIGYLFGIKSERQIFKEIQVNLAYRWFLGFGFNDKIPHHSIISKTRKRRFANNDLFQEIFDNIVKLGIENGLVNGKILYTDSTHIKANANKNKFIKIVVKRTTKEYIKDLDEAVAEDRKKHNIKPLPPKEPQEETKTIKSSTTDPDSGFMARDRKPQGFFYLDHRTTDPKCNFITDVFITPGNINDAVVYKSRLLRQIERFNFNVIAVGLDAGYNTVDNCRFLCEKGIMGVIGYKRGSHKKGFFSKNKFKFDSVNDQYICPNNKLLHYKTTRREGYKEYVSNAEDCKNCPHLSKCTSNKTRRKVLNRHVWEKYKDKINMNRLTFCGKEIYKRRKETIERSFANAKQNHGYRYARYRGLEKVKEQALMTACTQNLVKLVKYFKRINKKLKKGSILTKILKFFDYFGYIVSHSELMQQYHHQY